jgi:uncharacterized protein (UPF0147 family)
VPEDSDTISKKLLQCNEAMLFLNELINRKQNCSDIRILIIKSKYRKSGNVIILNEVPNDVMINNNPAYLEIVIYNIVSISIWDSHPDKKPIIILT